MGPIFKESNKMANISPSSNALDSITECLAAAAAAARGLDFEAAQDLRSLLHVASREASRARKSVRKEATAKRSSAKKNAVKATVKAAPQPAAGRRKAGRAN